MRLLSMRFALLVLNPSKLPSAEERHSSSSAPWSEHASALEVLRHKTSDVNVFVGAATPTDFAGLT